ncbi:helix-turn-helix domain-containing protein [Yanshouia hominis]|uniref:Helix-turn-helix transcriptional regulator n=1 Tax=Yanshouia hominis TaxID=2763673 RepID=A0ABR7NHT6_9FIRM|nr:helix-turn-helix transcriptional regulator [Yanshouia hominis]MBC8575864.1 helix-turn-helix transcriptional regulator [Yanshouia hominis]
MTLDEMIENAQENHTLFSEISARQKKEIALRALAASTLHRYRMSLGLTQTEFATKYGISQSLVSKWENGDENLSVKSLLQICTICGCKLAFVPDALSEIPQEQRQIRTFCNAPSSKYVSRTSNQGGCAYAGVY